MSPMPKCQVLHIVGPCLWYFYLNEVIFAVLDVSSLPLQKRETSMDVFYINICWLKIYLGLNSFAAASDPTREALWVH